MIQASVPKNGKRVFADGGSHEKAYNKCHFCGGRVTEQRVVVDYRWGEDLLAIIEDVPAGVCHTCGERYFNAEVVKAMEETAQSRSRDRRTIECRCANSRSRARISGSC
jgi:YgiT-type zinc finger domain-containing protein